MPRIRRARRTSARALILGRVRVLYVRAIAAAGVAAGAIVRDHMPAPLTLRPGEIAPASAVSAVPGPGRGAVPRGDGPVPFEVLAAWPVAHWRLLLLIAAGLWLAYAAISVGVEDRVPWPLRQIASWWMRDARLVDQLADPDVCPYCGERIEPYDDVALHECHGEVGF